MSAAKDKPLYQMIISDIQNTIMSRAFDYDKPLCTEKSLCEKYNVSRITAKHAIKELESAGILYRKRGVGSFVTRPEEQAEAKSSGSTAPRKVFALLVPFKTTNGGVFKAIESASAILTRLQCQLTIYVSELNVNRERELLEQLYAQDVDGIVYYPWTSDLPVEVLNRFIEKNKPVIILDKTYSHEKISSIVCDNYHGGYLLTEHVVSYGHKQICYLSRFTPEELSSVHDRYTGYADCLRDYGVGIPPRFVHWDIHIHAGYPMLKHIVNTLYLEGVTAILCENDEVAFNVYMCCRSLGIRVPDDMNITGFDNIEWATTGSAQITTIDQNFALIGEAIADIIRQDDCAPCQRVVPARLIPRTSTGKAVHR